MSAFKITKVTPGELDRVNITVAIDESIPVGLKVGAQSNYVHEYAEAYIKVIYGGMCKYVSLLNAGREKSSAWHSNGVVISTLIKMLCGIAQEHTFEIPVGECDRVTDVIMSSGESVMAAIETIPDVRNEVKQFTMSRDEQKEKKAQAIMAKAGLIHNKDNEDEDDRVEVLPIRIDPHNCARQEYDELIKYLEENCWAWSVIKKQ